jgi:hypothetical protein
MGRWALQDLLRLCCIALEPCQTLLNSSEPCDLLFHLIDLGCDQISNVRTSIWLTILDQQQLANLLKREAKASTMTPALIGLRGEHVLHPP